MHVTLAEAAERGTTMLKIYVYEVRLYNLGYCNVIITIYTSSMWILITAAISASEEKGKTTK